MNIVALHQEPRRANIDGALIVVGIVSLGVAVAIVVLVAFALVGLSEDT